MKNSILLTGLILISSMSIQAQTSEVTENSQTAIQTNGLQLFENGAVKLNIDLSRTDAYYKWSIEADSLYAFDAEISWDKESLTEYKEMYASIDLAEVGTKYKNWLKTVSSDEQFVSTGKSRYRINQRY